MNTRPAKKDAGSERKTLKAVGSSLKYAREGLGLTMPALAELSGVSKGQISAIERGRNFTVLTLYRLSFSLDYNPGNLLPPHQR